AGRGGADGAGSAGRRQRGAGDVVARVNLAKGDNGATAEGGGAGKGDGAEMMPYLVERLLELDDTHAAEVYRFKLQTLEGEGGAGSERGATQFLLAVALEKGGGEGEAAQL